MWRYDARRGSASPGELASELHLQWTRELPAPAPAWPTTQGKLQFDAQAEPVVMGERIFVPSSRNDSVTAFSTRTGEMLWQFFADGPVRFAPVAKEGRVFFNSDDGHLYAVNAESGELLWKVFGGPAQRWLIGNDRMISTWPARGGVVLHQDRLVFAAGIWPFMGIFVHAVDPETGAILWTNSGDGTNYSIQPHDAPSFAGLVPQGHIAAEGDALIVPGGRSTPGIYEIATGAQRFFNFDKRAGGHDVGISGELFFTAGHAYLLKNGNPVGGGAPAVFDGETLFAADPGSLLGRSSKVRFEVEKSVDRKGAKVEEITPKFTQAFSSKLDDPISGRWFLRAGTRYFAGGDGEVAGYEIGKATPVWKGKVDGGVVTMLAADERLFALTDKGTLHCFGAESLPAPVAHQLEKTSLTVSDAWKTRAREILSREGNSEGFALALGIGSGGLIEALLSESNLHVIAIDSDSVKIRAIREKVAAAGYYGSRFSAIHGDFSSVAMAPYFANLIVMEDAPPADSDALIAKAFQCLRPYGGEAWLPLAKEAHAPFSQAIAASTLANAKVERSADQTLLIREGALPNTDDWTHQYANAAQTVVSRDAKVRAPFGVLWFGGPSHEGILPRHGHGPSPQVAGGRLFIEGADMLRAVDVYTGRLLWERELVSLGTYYDTTAHFPGAGEIGSNYVSLPDRLYVVYGREILELDAASGETVKSFTLPPDSGKAGDPPPFWGFASVSGDFLVATSTPIGLDLKGDDEKTKSASPKTDTTDLDDLLPATQYATGSRRLVVFDRHSGERLWSREAAFNFRHNNIALSADRLFCIDRLTDERAAVLERRGVKFSGEPAMYALDLKNGDVIWEQHEGVFGTFLNYSAEHDVLLQGGSSYRDRATDEAKSGLMAIRGGTGETLWHQPKLTYSGPCLLWHDQILTNGSDGFALNLLTGKATGWSFTRMYGCNTAVGSDHLMTFRSGAAGFFDLANDSGTGNLGGFKSSCTNNLIPANGVLNAPDYTRTCTCSYQNQTSLALVHMPEAEFWTYGGHANAKRIGINFGAPGDRRSDDGTLFLEFPDVGGESEKIEFEIEGRDLSYHRQHASLIGGDPLPWVAASQVQGIERLVIPAPAGAASCTVRLFFAELDTTAPGQRVCDIIVQGKSAITGLDIAAEAGNRRALVKELKSIAIPSGGKHNITLEFHPKSGSLPAILSGVEIIAGE